MTTRLAGCFLVLCLAFAGCSQGTPAGPTTNVNSGSGVQNVCTGRGDVVCTTNPPSVVPPVVVAAPGTEVVE
jgi:hypothetical protein